MAIWVKKLQRFARKTKHEIYALYLAARDLRTPWCARLLVAGIVAYAISPIDLVPDFIPVIGYLDDLILLPIAISLAIKLTPERVMQECRLLAQTRFESGKPMSRVAGVVIVLVWVVAAVVIGQALLEWL